MHPPRFVLIGGGHNGLVCAAYLARAGVDVTLLERREVWGGACVTEPRSPDSTSAAPEPTREEA